jgi:hypothetical protein
LRDAVDEEEPAVEREKAPEHDREGGEGDHDPSDRLAAMKYAMDTENMWTGVLYHEPDRPSLEAVHASYVEKAREKNKKSPTPLLKLYQELGGTVPQ